MTYEEIKNNLPDNVERWHYERLQKACAGMGLSNVSIEGDKIEFLDKFGHGFVFPQSSIVPVSIKLKAANL